MSLKMWSLPSKEVLVIRAKRKGKPMMIYLAKASLLCLLLHLLCFASQNICALYATLVVEWLGFCALDRITSRMLS